MEIRKPTLSSAAVILKKRLAAQGISITHVEALEHAAVMEGYQSYQAYQAHQLEMKDWDAPALVMEAPDECGRDYRYVGPHNAGVWIRMRNISVKLTNADEGVIVDMYAAGAEDDDSLASTYCHYSEAADVLLERAEDIDDAKKYVERLLGYEKVTVEMDADSKQWHWKQAKKPRSSASFPDQWAAQAAAYETVFN